MTVLVRNVCFNKNVPVFVIIPQLWGFSYLQKLHFIFLMQAQKCEGFSSLFILINVNFCNHKYLS